MAQESPIEKRNKQQQPNRVRCVHIKTGRVKYLMPHIANNPARMAATGFEIAEVEEVEELPKVKKQPKEAPKVEEQTKEETTAEEIDGHSVTTLRSKDYSPMGKALELMGGMDKEDVEAFTQGETRKGVLNAAAEILGK